MRRSLWDLAFKVCLAVCLLTCAGGLVLIGYLLGAGNGPTESRPAQQRTYPVPACATLLGNPAWPGYVLGEGCHVEGYLQGAAVYDCTDGSQLVQVGDWGYGNTRSLLHVGNVNTDSATEYQALTATCLGN